MSEDKRVIGNLRSPGFFFFFHTSEAGEIRLKMGGYTWIWRDALWEARRGFEGGFYKMVLFSSCI